VVWKIDTDPVNSMGFLFLKNFKNLIKTMKSEVEFEYRSETYWQVRRARNGEFDKEFAF
jgi:hypothetical protein